MRGIRDWINGSTANTGNHWVELEVWGWSNIYYVNKYYEYRGHHVQSSRYYYFGDQRIAMRRGEANGHLLTDLRYNAWGAARLASGSTATSLRYTGQREDEEIPNLYDYGARWYDAGLARFLQADAIIPESQGVLGHDRYAYANNNPLLAT